MTPCFFERWGYENNLDNGQKDSIRENYSVRLANSNAATES